MYWISVTALSAAWYCYCRGRKLTAPAGAETVVEENLDEVPVVIVEAPDTVDAEPEAPEAPEAEETAEPAPEPAAETEEAPAPEAEPVPENHGDPLEALAAAGQIRDPLERHAVFTKGIDLAYKTRRQDPEMQEVVVNYGTRYVREFADIKDALFDHLGGDGPKNIAVFKQLAIALEEADAHDQAVDVCQKAMGFGLEDGTKSGWEGRIKRIEKNRAAG